MRDARAALRGGGREAADRFESVTDALDDAIERTEKAARTAGLDPADACKDACRKYDDPNPRQALTEIREARLEIRDAPLDSDAGRDRTLNELSRAADRLETALRPIR